jgi:hypothetical protein
MKVLGRDGIGRIVALAAGLAVGIRAQQVADLFYKQGSYYAISGAGMVIGLVVAVAFFGGLALWRLNRSPQGTGGPRLVALDAGIIFGALVGWVVFSAF